MLDERPDKHNAGIRTIQDKPDRSDIFIEGDVTAWFRAGVERGLALAQFPKDPAAKFDLTFKLRASTSRKSPIGTRHSRAESSSISR